jgi:hypothetical protein
LQQQAVLQRSAFRQKRKPKPKDPKAGKREKGKNEDQSQYYNPKLLFPIKPPPSKLLI